MKFIHIFKNLENFVIGICVDNFVSKAGFIIVKLKVLMVTQLLKTNISRIQVLSHSANSFHNDKKLQAGEAASKVCFMVCL